MNKTFFQKLYCEAFMHEASYLKKSHCEWCQWKCQLTQVEYPKSSDVRRTVPFANEYSQHSANF